MNELVSVIIPTHQGADVVARAVESVLNQTYSFVEAIVVDDNGKDSQEQLNTQSSLEKYLELPNVKYMVHEKSMHGAAARNTGIKASKGDYIAFLDDDDYYKSNNIEQHLKAINGCDNNYGISYCGLNLKRVGFADEIIEASFSGDALLEHLLGHLYIGSSQILVKKEAIDYTKGFDATFKRHQDWEFIARVLDKYHLVSVNNIGVVKVNLNRNSASNPELVEKYRLYYLDKMKYLIDKFPEDNKKAVYVNHYFDIAKEYFKAHKVIRCTYWSFKTKRPFYCIKKIWSDGITYLKKRN